MAKVVFRSISKTSHADTLLDGLIFSDIGPTGKFGGKIFELILIKFKS